VAARKPGVKFIRCSATLYAAYQNSIALPNMTDKISEVRGVVVLQFEGRPSADGVL